MTAGIFAAFAFAILLGIAGRRLLALLVFAGGFAVSLYWFGHHATDTLNLAF